MKTAMFIPDAEFERFERLRARQGLNRSQFYRRAAIFYADALEGTSNLTEIANAALRDAGQDDDLFVRQNEQRLAEGGEW